MKSEIVFLPPRFVRSCYSNRICPCCNRISGHSKKQFPDKSYSTIPSEFRTGTAVTIIKYSSDWCEIEVGGIRGFVMTEYLVKS